jgi:hypothetical protein
MTIVKTFDPSSYELAEHFLQDEARSDDQALYKKRCQDLALTIQQSVEDWFFMDDLPTAQDVRGILSEDH